MTTEATESFAPIREGARIQLLDVLRGLAVCGILPVNIIVMGTVGDTQGLTYPARWNADWITWSLQHVLLEGPMRGLFTILFGAGMLIMLRRTEGERPDIVPIDVWARRCLALLLLGIVQFAVFLWPGEILWTYGVAGLALLAFRTARPRTLWLWALLIMLGLSAFRTYDTGERVTTYQRAHSAEVAQAAGRWISSEEKQALDAARAAQAAVYPSDDSLAEEVRQRTSIGGLLRWSASGWAARHLGNYSWWGVAESLGFMLVGMALYRSGILTGAGSMSRYRSMLLWGCGIGLLLRSADLAWQARTGFELDLHRLSLTASLLRSFLYEPARLALTLGYIGLIVLLFRSGAFGAAHAVRALGRMALTTYCLQSILTSILFYGFGYVGAFDFVSLMIVSVGIWTATALFCVWWLKHSPIGPAERLLRALAYNSLRSDHRPQAEIVAGSPPL
ncbi:MAG: DUF418 domain-containing protein [Sphingobium sp.]|uniref:DUF418 domain-containing protein n=1 Tax=Sphingobium sp. TaxID=1912891 RepID=UPI0029A5700F|nr:DUF418 domain-containing protein [Sphingobium sp.]MDX3910682.1 DUF418 domain-containing protein [Sphingobium sp.]